MLRGAGFRPQTDSSAHAGAGRTLLLAFLVLVVIELVLQIRAEIRTGQSVFDLLAGQTTFVMDPDLGFYVLRPNARTEGRRASIRSNRYGLRGEDFPPVKEAGEIRIVLLGASTIMGVNARDESGTSSVILQQLLNSRIPSSQVRVINGGLSGLTVEQQEILLARRLLPLQPDVVVWYPGSNDVGCAAVAKPGTRRSWKLPSLDLPDWVILDDIIRKNTSALRNSRVKSSAGTPSTDWSGIEQALRTGIRAATQSGAKVLLVASSQSFRAGMDPDLMSRRAASALGFRPCYSVSGYLAEMGRLSRMLEVVADEEGAQFLPAAERVPSEARYFADASHFSLEGEHLFAESLADTLIVDLPSGSADPR